MGLGRRMERGKREGAREVEGEEFVSRLEGWGGKGKGKGGGKRTEKRMGKRMGRGRREEKEKSREEEEKELVTVGSNFSIFLIVL
jgi:hypothetical protein